MAVCQPCRDRSHSDCKSANCVCGHRGSTVRALTSVERHALMLGLYDEKTAPAGKKPPSMTELRQVARLSDLSLVPAPTPHVVIRTNGHHQ